jgi:hypothetical protein
MSHIIAPRFPADLAAIAPNVARGGDAVMRGRTGGKWPYQWLYPGPNSRHVLERGSVATPAFAAAPAVVASYTVPEGYRFSLRAVVVDGSQVSNWVPGSSDMLFNLRVISPGTRIVDYFQDVKTPLGSTVIPWPVLGRLEFTSDDVLQWDVATVQNVGVGDPNFVSCFLLGHIYPNSEADD